MKDKKNHEQERVKACRAVGRELKKCRREPLHRVEFSQFFMGNIATEE